MALLTIHKISVLLFLLIYLIKTILLVANQNAKLEQFKKMTKVLEMIVSAAFLITGVWMLIAAGSIKMFQIIKLVMVVASIPLAVIAYKKSNKALAIISLLLIIMAYGLAEMSKKQKAMGTDESGINSGNAAEMGKNVYSGYCEKCHGEDGKKGFMNATDLSLSTLDNAGITEIVSNGKQDMTPFKDVLTAEQILAVSGYIQTLRK